MKDRRRDLRRAQTDAERKLWSLLRDKKLDGLKFFRQYSFGCYILDFYSPSGRLAIEADGSQHIDSDYDIERTLYLEGFGIRVLRFWNNDILKNPEGVYQRIVSAQRPTLTTPPASS